ncbi:MAG: DUF1887 family protein [Clostridia bacterium]|nr:DUF1887 family protein [Clostridia bacterium]
MTIVEFYDKSPIENIASSLLCTPLDAHTLSRVIFVGNDGRKMDKSIELYREITERRNLSIDFSRRTVNRHSLADIVSVLSGIAEEFPGCIFDLTGGEDLVLVAVGMVAQKYPGIRLHRFNVRNGTLIDCDADGETLDVGSDLLTIDENVRIHGGRVIYCGEDPDGTYIWDFNDDEFRRDIDAMWEICRKNPGIWNAQINTLDKISVMLAQKNTYDLELSVDKERARRTMAADGDKFVLRMDILKQLEAAGLISGLRETEEDFSLEFKNYPVKRALTQAGTILELYVTMTAAGLYEPNGSPVYDDVLNGVYIDWDGELHPDASVDVGNEIDVILMKGMVPVFISCKNGYVDADELYKLSAVADRFGRGYVKKVLIVSDLDRMGAAGDYIYARATDMGIKVIKNAAELTDIEMARKLRNLTM